MTISVEIPRFDGGTFAGQAAPGVILLGCNAREAARLPAKIAALAHEIEPAGTALLGFDVTKPRTDKWNAPLPGNEPFTE